MTRANPITPPAIMMYMFVSVAVVSLLAFLVLVVVETVVTGGLTGFTVKLIAQRFKYLHFKYFGKIPTSCSAFHQRTKLASQLLIEALQLDIVTGFWLQIVHDKTPDILSFHGGYHVVVSSSCSYDVVYVESIDGHVIRRALKKDYQIYDKKFKKIKSIYPPPSIS